MHFEATAIDGVYIIHLHKIEDDRGFFARTFCSEEFSNEALADNFVQANICQTKYAGTFRGFHYQVKPHAENKLIRCVSGSIFDVAVDLRAESPTYLQSVGVALSAANTVSLYIPNYCAHGYLTL